MLKRIRINQTAAFYSRKTGQHQYGHSHSVTVPKNPFTHKNDKYVTYVTVNGDLYFKKVNHNKLPFHGKDLFNDPSWNRKNIKQGLNKSGISMDQGNSIGKENID